MSEDKIYYLVVQRVLLLRLRWIQFRLFRLHVYFDVDRILLRGGGHYLIRGGKISVQLDFWFNVQGYKLWGLGFGWVVLRSVILCFFDVWVVHLFFRFVDCFSS
jgi:hypothetical protein